MKTTGLLALIIALVWIGCANQPDKYDQLFEDSFMLPEITVTAPASRGDFDSKPLAEAIDHYKTGKYKKAVTQFDAFLEKNPEFIEVRYFRALTLLKLDRPEEGAQDLEAVLSGDSKHKENAQWYLALTYIKLRQKEKAAQMLQAIANSGSTQAQKAKVALSTMSEWPD